MEIILYSTGCPKCNILKSKLDGAGIKYAEIKDVNVMLDKGIMAVPVLKVDDNVMDFVSANKWINERGK